MGQARLRGSFQDRVLAAYNRKVNCVGLKAKTLEEIANEAGVPTDSIGKGYLIYFIHERKFLAEDDTKVNLPAYAKIFIEYEDVISLAARLNKQNKVEIYYLFDCSQNIKQYVVQVISLNN